MRTIQETDYVDKAEAAIKKHKSRIKRNGNPEPMVTTSKIRGLLSMSADIYNQLVHRNDDRLGSEDVGRINYLRMRFVYESGRDESVRNFVEDADILTVMKEIGTDRKNFILFNHYMEALVAFHKFNHGKEN